MNFAPPQEAAASPFRPAPRQNGSGGALHRNGRISVLFIDSRPLTRECLPYGLRAHAKDLCVLPFAGLAEVPEGATLAKEADLVLLNVTGASPSEPHVAEVLEAIQLKLPGIPIVLLSDREETEAAVAAIHRGARGYIPMGMDLGLVVGALRFIAAGGTFVPTEAILEIVQEQRAASGQPEPLHEAPGGAPAREGRRFAGFTARQLEVLRYLRRGKSNKIIAYELGMQESTVKAHVRHILKKLGATNRSEAALLTQGLADLPGKGAGTGAENGAASGDAIPNTRAG